MPTTIPTRRGIDPAATAPIPRVEATLRLSTRTVAWLAQRPHDRLVVDSVWETLTELERADHPPRTIAALRFVLIHHQPPTRTGRCPTCRRVNWRGLWRRRRFPCVVWRQIRGELLGHLTLNGSDRLRTEGSRSAQ